MKKVMDASKVAHAWANKTQSEARTPNSNVYFDGDTIYSYGSHFPIAKHVVNDKGIEVVLFTERRYSNTTAKHISVVSSACHHLDRIYCNNPESSHDSNFLVWQRLGESVVSNLTTARKPEKYLNELSGIEYKAKQYANFFGVEVPADLMAVLSIGDKESYVQYAEKKEADRIAREKQAKKDAEKRHKKELAKWLSGEGNRLYTHTGEDYLRVKGDKVETSQAVEMSIPAAIRIYEQLKSETLKVGSQVLDAYTVKKINGVVQIGCHTFKKDYLLKFGEQLTK